MAKALILAMLIGLIGSAYAAPHETLPASGQNGRYQIVFSPHGSKFTYLLDTQTGRIWLSVLDPENNESVWQEQFVLDGNGSTRMSQALYFKLFKPKKTEAEENINNEEKQKTNPPQNSSETEHFQPFHKLN